MRFFGRPKSLIKRGARLARDDGRALALAKDHERLFALAETVEKVSLELLIAKFENQLANGGSKPQWPPLLDQNPFIPSLVFGYPIVRLASQGADPGSNIVGG